MRPVPASTELLGFLLGHALLGGLAGAAFAAGLLITDVGQLGTLVHRSASPLPAVIVIAASAMAAAPVAVATALGLLEKATLARRPPL